MEKICVVIPAFGNPSNCKNIVHNIISCIQIHPLLITIVDNGLNKKIDLSEFNTDLIQFLNPGRNLFYIDSLSYAISKNIEYDYFVLLNDDLHLTSGFNLGLAINRIKHLKSQGAEAICCPAILITNSNRVVNCTGLYRKGPIYVCRDYLKNYDAVKSKSFYKTHNVTGAALIGHRDNLVKILSKLGRWNCMYLEDAAIGISADILNIQQYCFADIYAYHDFSPVIKSLKKIRRYARGYIRFLKFLIINFKSIANSKVKN